MEIADKTVLITGASGGIGAAVARRLASHGMAVALAGRNSDRLAAVAESCRSHGAAADVFVGDITDEDYTAGLPDAVKGRFGSFHVLVNNAGVFEVGAFDTIDLAKWKLRST